MSTESFDLCFVGFCGDGGGWTVVVADPLIGSFIFYDIA
jgi:hypothetical protein